MMVKVGDVIQVRAHVPAWGGCLMVVEEVKDWYVKCYMRIPKRKPKIVRLTLNHSEYYVIGKGRIFIELVEDENE